MHVTFGSLSWTSIAIVLGVYFALYLAFPADHWAYGFGYLLAGRLVDWMRLGLLVDDA